MIDSKSEETMASALATLGNAHRFHRFFDLTVFAAITAGYIVLVGSLASVLGSSNQTPGPGTEQPQICQCGSKDERDVPLDAAAADLQWTWVRAATAENCS
jgi:hypothetical protein